MKKRSCYAILTLCALLAFAGCKKKQDKIDMDEITTEASAPSESQTTAAAEDPKATTEAVKKAYVEETAYLEKNLGIKYPQIANMDDEDKQTKANKQISEDILSIIDAKKLNKEKDFINLTYKVSALDRNRIVILYEGSMQADGAAYPTALFITDTINLSTGKHTRLSDYIDGKTLSSLITSDGDYKVITEDPALEKEVRKHLSSQKAASFEKILNNADFGGTGDTFPESFSYEKQGVIYFTVPVPHALGDYALLAYTPETK